MAETLPAPRWWAIREDELLRALCKTADGDDPGVVLTELFANSETREVPPDA